MKIDMSSAAVTSRLRQVEQLRRLCLSLARSSVGLEIIQRHKETNAIVQRTAKALGKNPKR